MATNFLKDPDAVLDYKFDWQALTNGSGDSDWLASSETIDTYTIEADTGITVDSDSKTDADTSITVWLSGGTVETSYDIRCEIVTTDNRTDERTITIRIWER